MPASLEQIAELLRSESGIVIKPAQYGSLRAAIGRAAPRTDAAAFLRLAADPVNGPEALSRLIDEVTVKETFFLRDRRQLEAIGWRSLLEAARAAGSTELTVWTAGCATGEEAYSLALLACEAFASPYPPVRILATDISGAAIEHAEAGRYRQRSVRELEARLRERYFAVEGDRLVVGDELRSLVTFARHNLVRDPVPPLGEAPFDLIICRNVLIYFGGETVEQVIEALERALRPYGMLVLGAADQLCGTARRLARIGTGVLPRRRGGGAARPAAPGRALRRPLGRQARATPEERLARAVAAADGGRSEEALAEAERLLADDPLNADAYYLRGLLELEAGHTPAAVGALRRALYVDPGFGLAAFHLGRAQEAAGDGAAAVRAYEQALRTFDPEDDRHELLMEQVDLGDVAGACRARIAVLRRPR